MINKYWDPQYEELIRRVRTWNDLEKGCYDINKPKAYTDLAWYDLSETQIESMIEKTQADFKKYFYCPTCGRKFLITDAIVKSKTNNFSIKLDNATMPGWMNIQASSESISIRVCPKCARHLDALSSINLIKAFDGNAIVLNNRKTKTSKGNTGCLGFIAAIFAVATAACWIICLIK
ncbi:hypothetical protein [Prevotella sp. P6B1]|uniref:hypothetical protein n=1 Tax=Prevotella sp. P6B1 TaxID=1410613 RepID=UPI00051C98B9|nr:hypothetical protein [Prevotella sp. P6B1]